MIPLGWPAKPALVMTKLEPALEKVPPVQMLAPVKAPVEKLTEPRACPGRAVRPPNMFSWDPLDTIPALVMVTVPNWLVIAIPLAQAGIGNSSAHKPNTTAIRFILLSPQNLSCLFQQPWGRSESSGSLTVVLLVSRTL